MHTVPFTIFGCSCSQLYSISFYFDREHCKTCLITFAQYVCKFVAMFEISLNKIKLGSFNINKERN